MFVFFCFILLAVSAFGQEQKAEDFAYLSYVKGNVLLGEELAKQDLLLRQGDWLFTKKDGRAEICFGENGFLSIDENSKIYFLELGQEKTIIVAYQGSIYLRNLQNVELRASGKPEGKIIFADRDKITRVDMANGKIKTYENPSIRDGFDSWNSARLEKESKQEQEQGTEIQEAERTQRDEGIYYGRIYWRYYWALCGWYQAMWYPVYYICNYGYYGQNYRSNFYGENYQNYSGRQVVNQNQLRRSRYINPQSSRMNVSGNGSMRTSVRKSVHHYLNPFRSLLRSSSKIRVSSHQGYSSSRRYVSRRSSSSTSKTSNRKSSYRGSIRRK